MVILISLLLGDDDGMGFTGDRGCTTGNGEGDRHGYRYYVHTISVDGVGCDLNFEPVHDTVCICVSTLPTYLPLLDLRLGRKNSFLLFRMFELYKLSSVLFRPVWWILLEFL